MNVAERWKTHDRQRAGVAHRHKQRTFFMSNAEILIVKEHRKLVLHGQNITVAAAASVMEAYSKKNNKAWTLPKGK